MAHVVVRWIDREGVFRSGGESAVATALAEAWAWIDVTDPDQETLAPIAEQLDLHALAVEDALHPQSRPKLDLYPNGPFIAWLSPRLNGERTLVLDEVDCFVTRRALVTSHRGVVEAVDEAADEAEELLRRGSEWILHGILDRLVDSMLPIVDHFGDRLEDLEDRMLAAASKTDLEDLYSARRKLLQMHRIVSPERDMLLSLSRQEEFVSEEVFRYFSDVVDHLLRVQESLETFRDIGSGVMDIFLSAQSNRLNEIMKVLTVVTVVLGALTAISGIYGMNLLNGMWPPPDARWSFGAAILAMATAAILMSAYFRRKNWW